MPGPNDLQMLRIRTEEKTFKSLADSILNMKVTSEIDITNRCALINSAKSFIDGQLRRNIRSGYIPLEAYLSPEEMAWGRASIKHVKEWLSFNLDMFERNSSGRLFG